MCAYFSVHNYRTSILQQNITRRILVHHIKDTLVVKCQPIGDHSLVNFGMKLGRFNKFGGFKVCFAAGSKARPFPGEIRRAMKITPGHSERSHLARKQQNYIRKSLKADCIDL